MYIYSMWKILLLHLSISTYYIVYIYMYKYMNSFKYVYIYILRIIIYHPLIGRIDPRRWYGGHSDPTICAKMPQ